MSNTKIANNHDNPHMMMHPNICNATDLKKYEITVQYYWKTATKTIVSKTDLRFL